MTFEPGDIEGVAEMDGEELVGDAWLLTNVVCAAAVIERAAVAAPTNRRDPYMLLISARQVLPGGRVSSREWYRLKEGGRKKKTPRSTEGRGGPSDKERERGQPLGWGRVHSQGPRRNKPTTDTVQLLLKTWVGWTVGIERGGAA